MNLRRGLALLVFALSAGLVIGFGSVTLAGWGARLPVAPPPTTSAVALSATPTPTTPTTMPTDGPATASPSPGASASPSASPPEYTGPVTRLVPVLMYHRIADPPPGTPYPGLYVSPADFAAQMRALHAAGWRTITAGELGAAMAADRPVPVRTFVVMFDDGYKDNYTAALPVLQRYGYVATFSVVTAGGGSMMTSAQLATMITDGMEIGNHTLKHANVSRLSGAALLDQIQGGALRLEARLAAEGMAGYVPRTFVYPSGHVGPAALALLRQLGYTDAFTEVPAIAVIGSTPLLEIPRIRVSRGETLAKFLARFPQEPKA